MAPNLPELPEREATGRIAAIYAEIRHLGGVPMVALIFRHLATLPGALDWTWEAISPAWRSGRLQEAAWEVARRVPVEPVAPISRRALAELGVDEEARRQISTVLEAYNRANPENLLSVLCLLRLAGGRRTNRPLPPRLWTPPPPPGPLVAMGDVDTLPPDLAELLSTVSGASPAGGARVVQSLYRHLFHWPAFLSMAVKLVRQAIDQGSLAASGDRLRVAMATAADDIVVGLSAPPAPCPDIVPVCARFGGSIIPEMVVAGRILQQAMDERDTPR